MGWEARRREARGIDTSDKLSELIMVAERKRLFTLLCVCLYGCLCVGVS